jgi:hypothetical protein
MTMLVTLLAMGVSVAACGDDGDGDETSAQAQDYVDAIVASSDDDSQLTQEENECFARAFVDTVGLERLREVVTPEEIRENPESSPGELGLTLDDTQGDALWDGLNDCMDVKAAFLESLAGDDGLPAETVTCLEGALDDDMLKQLLLVSLMGGDEDVEENEAVVSELVAVFDQCTPAEQG